MFTSKSMSLFAVLTVLVLACPTFAGVILSLDMGPATSPVQSGFQAFDAASLTYGTITVSETGGGFFDRTTDGFDALNFGTPLPDLYRDFLYMNGGPFTVEIDGLLPGTPYQIRIYSYDRGQGGTDTNTFTPTTGTGAAGSVTYIADDAHDPTTPDQYSTLVTWTTDGTGTLVFTADGSVSGGSPRIDGLVISVPEPASLGLLAVGVSSMLLRRRR